MACGTCGGNRPKQDFMITYRDGTTERVPAAEGVVRVRQKIIKGGGGSYALVPVGK